MIRPFSIKNALPSFDTHNMKSFKISRGKNNTDAVFYAEFKYKRKLFLTFEY